MELRRDHITRCLKFLRTGAGTLSVIAVGAAALALFLHIVSETIYEGEGREMDLGILNALRLPGQPGAPIGPAWFTDMARDLTSMGSISVLVFVALVVVGFALVRQRYNAAILIAVALGGGMLMCTWLKDLFERERPPEAYRLVEVINASFPSGHAMLSAVFYLTLAVLVARAQTQKRLKFYVISIAILTTAMVGLTRIYLGVHWTSDVLAGWSVGAAWAVACWLASFAWERLAHRKMVEPGPPAFGHAADAEAKPNA